MAYTIGTMGLEVLKHLFCPAGHPFYAALLFFFGILCCCPSCLNCAACPSKKLLQGPGRAGIHRFLPPPSSEAALPRAMESMEALRRGRARLWPFVLPAGYSFNLGWPARFNLSFSVSLRRPGPPAFI